MSTRRRVDHKAGAADDEGVGMTDGRDSPDSTCLLRALHKGPRPAYYAPHLAAGHTSAVGDEIHAVERPAVHAVVAQRAAVQAVYLL